MPNPYKCAYCGSQQTWDGSGSPVCTHCGATQPEKPAAPALPVRRKFRWWLFFLGLLIVGAPAWYFFLRTPKHQQPAPIVDGASGSPANGTTRLVAVRNPAIRILPAGTDYSLLDILRSAPGSSAPMFDTSLLTITQPRAMKDVDDHLYFVGEVTNHSPNMTALAPAVGMTIFKNGRKLETTDLEFSDLPPGAHAPAWFTWDGAYNDIDHYQFKWKPVQARPSAQPHQARLVTTLDSKTLTPTNVEVNFSYTFRYVTADCHGTVTNRGDATAKGIQLYLILHDAQGRVTGFKEKDLNQLAPGQSVDWQLAADQWSNPIATVEAEALPVTDPNL